MTRSVKDLLPATWKGLHVALVLTLVSSVAAVGARVPSESPSGLSFGSLPLYFEANHGQADAGFKFVARSRVACFMVAPTEAVLTLTRPGASVGSRHHRSIIAEAAATARELRLEFVGANPAATVSGAGVLPGKASYFLGNDPAQWRTGVPLFAQARVEQVYPGVDLVYYGNESRLEYDFVVAPGANPKMIVVQFKGADRIRVNAEGDLIFSLDQDEIRQPKPFVYQIENGVRKQIAGSYVLVGGDTMTFQIGDYNRAQPLVIDPVLSYSTYFGGGGVDVAWAVAVDASGSVYVAGESMGGLPVRAGTATNNFSGSARGHGDAFVAKFDNTGSNLVYLAYLGGRTADVGLSLAVDEAGSAFVTGYTDSTNFPTVNAVFPALAGKAFPGLNAFPIDAFVTKLNAAGTALVYSTYLGGEWIDEGVGIAVDPTGNAFVTGYTESTNFPTAGTLPALTNYGGGGDAFVAKISPFGTNLVYSLYLGGTNLDVGSDVVANAEGVAFVTGYTGSTNFPAINLLAGGLDAFVTAVGTQSNQATLFFSELIGGRADNAGYRITMDGDSDLYVVGSSTADATFPVTPSSLNPGGIFRSDNGATNWSQSSTGLLSVVVEDLAVDPSNPSNLFAATGRGIGQSLNGGARWFSPFPLEPNAAGLAPAGVVDEVLSVAVAPGTPPTIYAGVPTEGVAKSPDGGTNWFAPIGLAGRIVVALAVDPFVPSTVYAGTTAGIFKSTDSGTNWAAINSGLGNLSINALALNPATPSTLYAATAGGGVYRSANGGTNWTAFNTGLASLLARSLAIHPTTPSTLYAGSAGGVFKSADAGTNWIRMNTGLVVSNVTALAIDPVTPATVYAGTSDGLFKSVDGGTNWVANNNGLSARHILSLAINPESPATLYAGTAGNSVFGGMDVFVTKSGTNGYSAVLGGAGDDEGWDVAVDAGGRAHLTGTTASTNFPTRDVVGILRSANSGGSDAFVAQLSSGGDMLEHAAYLGGSGADAGYSIALDAEGNSFVVGATASVNFPTYEAFKATASGSNDAFLVKIIGESRPTLMIAGTTNFNEMLLTWPAYWTGFRIEAAAEADGSGGWVDQGGANVVTNGYFLRTIRYTSDPTLFFRLWR